MTTAQETAPSPYLVPSPAFSSPQIPERLVARISNQSGSEKLDISQCNLDDIPLQAIRENYEGNVLDLNISFNAISSVTPEFTLTFMYLTKLGIITHQRHCKFKKAKTKYVNGYGDADHLIFN